MHTVEGNSKDKAAKRSYPIGRPNNLWIWLSSILVHGKGKAGNCSLPFFCGVMKNINRHNV